MTITRRLTILTVALGVALTTFMTPSFAGAASTSVVAFNNVGLSDPISIAAHGQYVWIGDRSGGSDDSQVVRVNAHTGAHLSITSPLIDLPWALVSDGTYVWVENGGYPGSTRGSISRIDIATNKVSLVTRISSQVTLAIGGPYLWVANSEAGSLLRVNRTTLAITTITSPLLFQASALCADKHYLWVARDGGGSLYRGSLTRVSLTTGTVKGINSPYFNDPVTVTSNGTFVWMPASNHVVVKVDIATSKVIKISSKSFDTSLASASTSRYAYIASVDGNTHPNGGDNGAITQIGAKSNSLHVITSTHLTDPYAEAILGSAVWVIDTPLGLPNSRTKNLLLRVTP